MMNLQEHKLLKRAQELRWEVDMLPAHEDQTRLIINLGKWIDELYAHLKKHKLLCEFCSGTKLVTQFIKQGDKLIQTGLTECPECKK